MKPTHATPAIVVGSSITALGTIRCLARAGIKTYTVTPPGEVARASRWYRPPPGLSGSAVAPLDVLLPQLDLEQAVLFPCSDHSVSQACRLDETLRTRFPTALSDISVLDILVDKGLFATALQKAGLPHPRTWLLDTGVIPESVPDEVFASAFLKPADSQNFMAQFKVKAVKVRSREEADTRLREMVNHSMVLQEYIPGPSDNHYFIDGFVDSRHQVRALFARQRLRMFPPDFGNSSCMVSQPRERVAGAVDTIDRLLTTLRFRGIFSAEFKLDERDGQFKILEVNARPWWYVEFAARCGVNVCQLAYQDALGEPVETVPNYRTNASLVYTYYDFWACVGRLRRGEMSLGEWLGSWLSSCRPVFCWDDPWPSVRGTLTFLTRQARQLVRRAPATLQPR